MSHRPVLPILLCGQARSFPFTGCSQNASAQILQDYEVSFKLLSQTFDLKFYLFLDRVDVHLTLAFFNRFGDIRNLCLSETSFQLPFLSNGSQKVSMVPEVSHFRQMYDFVHPLMFQDQEHRYPNLVFQFYRNLVVFDMLEQDADVLNRTKFVVRMRPDITFPLAAAKHLQELILSAAAGDPAKEFLSCGWDLMFFGTVNVMRRCMRWLEITYACFPWQAPFTSKAYLIFHATEQHPLQKRKGSEEYRRWVTAPEGQLMAAVHSFVQEIGEHRFEVGGPVPGLRIVRC